MNDGLWLEPAEFFAFRARLLLHRRARHMTELRFRILDVLLRTIAGGRTIVTDAEIAELADCSARTVQRARADATAFGLLSAERQRQFVGGRWRQGANRYAVHMPAELVCPARQHVRARKEGRKKEADNVAPTLSSAEVERLRDIRIAASLQSARTSRMLRVANIANRSCSTCLERQPSYRTSRTTDTRPSQDAST